MKKGLKLVALHPQTLRYEECEVVGDWTEGPKGNSQKGPRCQFEDGIYDVVLWSIDPDASEKLNPIPTYLKGDRSPPRHK